MQRRRDRILLPVLEGNVLNDDCSSLTGWTVVVSGGTVTQVNDEPLSGDSTFKFSIPTAGTGYYVKIERGLGSVLGN